MQSATSENSSLSSGFVRAGNAEKRKLMNGISFKEAYGNLSVLGVQGFGCLSHSTYQGMFLQPPPYLDSCNTTKSQSPLGTIRVAYFWPQ